MRYIVSIGLLIVTMATSAYGSDAEESKGGAEDAKGAVSNKTRTLTDDVPRLWEAVSAEQDERTGVNPNRGNWFFKAQILKKALEPVKEVQRIVKEIKPFKNTYTKRIDEFKRDIAAFYQDYGFQDADVAANVQRIQDDIARNDQRLRQPAPAPVLQHVRASAVSQGARVNRPVQPPLPNPSDEIKRLKGDQVDIDALAHKMAQMKVVERALQDATVLINNLIDGAQDFEQQAWRDYEKISDTLSDVIAQECYRSIQAAITNAKNVKQYCAQTFEAFLSELVRDFKKLEEELRVSIEALAAKGYGFGKKAVERLEAERKAAEEEAARLKAAKEVKKEVPLTWWQQVGAFFARAWRAMTNAFSSFGRAIMRLFGR